MTDQHAGAYGRHTSVANVPRTIYRGTDGRAHLTNLCDDSSYLVAGTLAAINPDDVCAECLNNKTLPIEAGPRDVTSTGVDTDTDSARHLLWPLLHADTSARTAEERLTGFWLLLDEALGLVGRYMIDPALRSEARPVTLPPSNEFLQNMISTQFTFKQVQAEWPALQHADWPLRCAAVARFGYTKAPATIAGLYAPPFANPDVQADLIAGARSGLLLQWFSHAHVPTVSALAQAAIDGAAATNAWRGVLREARAGSVAHGGAVADLERLAQDLALLLLDDYATATAQDDVVVHWRSTEQSHVAGGSTSQRPPSSMLLSMIAATARLVVPIKQDGAMVIVRGAVAALVEGDVASESVESPDQHQGCGTYGPADAGDTAATLRWAYDLHHQRNTRHHDPQDALRSARAVVTSTHAIRADR